MRQRPRRREILINCDDLGVHPSVNNAIARLLKDGHVKSCSIMPPSLYFGQAVELLKRARCTRVGVHLTMHSEYLNLRMRPLAAPADIPSLVDEGGFFRREPDRTAPRIDPAQLRLEAELQIDRVKKAGLQISHLDGHMFFYEESETGTSELLSVIADIAKRLKIPMRCLTPAPPRKIDRTYFIWEGFDTIPSRHAYYDDLFRGYEDNVSELIIHPGDDLDAMLTFTKAAERRLADYRYFRGSGWLDILRDRAIQVIGWNDIA